MVCGFRHIGGKQTFYEDLELAYDTEEGLVPNSFNGQSRPLRRITPAKEVLLSEEQQLRLQSFLERFDAAAGMEPVLRLVASEMQTFFAFQACKCLQRIVKKFGSAPAKDMRIKRLIHRCTSTMVQADGVSMSRALWALGKLGLRDEPLLRAACVRLPAVMTDCGPITMAMVWKAFEVQQPPNAEPTLDIMAEECLRRLEECDPPEVAIVLHAAATLSFPSREKLFTALVPHVLQNQGRFSHRHLGVCFHAASRVGVRDEELCRTVVQRFSSNMADLDGLALTSAVFSCGLTAFFDESFFIKIADWLEREVNRRGRLPESQQVGNIIYTFGKLGFAKPQRCLEAVARHVMEDMWRFKEQELDNITYGFALIKFRHEPYLSKLCSHLIDDGRIDKLDPQSVVSLTYSMGMLSFLHHTTMRALGDRAIPMLPDFKAEEFSIMVYSMGLVNFRHHDLLEAIVIHAPPNFPRFSTQNLSNLLHGLGLVNYDREDGFVQAVVDHLITRLPECNPQDVVNPITALMRMTERHDEFLHRVADFITSPTSTMPVRDFTTQELANTVYGFDALQVFDRRLFDAVAEQTTQRLTKFVPQEVANIIWAFSRNSYGSLEWFDDILARCTPFAEAPNGVGSGQGLSQYWVSEDLEKPLGALWHVRHRLPSYQRIERVFRSRFLDQICAFLVSVAPQQGHPSPHQYQKDFAAWDLYQVGPLYTEELLGAVGIKREVLEHAAPAAHDQLMAHYMDAGDENSLISRYGEKLLFAVLPAARWLSCHVTYRLVSSTSTSPIAGQMVVEPGHPKDDESEANQRRFKAETWRRPLNFAAGAYRPILLSTFLGNWRHRHTEIVALDGLIDLILDQLENGSWSWDFSFWQELSGEVEMFVPHTPCLSCVGALAQLKQWAPKLRITVFYEDWREWRKKLRSVAGRA